MKYKIDVVRIRENSIQLNGWVIGKTPESKAEFEVLDQNKKPLEIKCVATRRDDAASLSWCLDEIRTFLAEPAYIEIQESLGQGQASAKRIFLDDFLYAETRNHRLLIHTYQQTGSG